MSNASENLTADALKLTEEILADWPRAAEVVFGVYLDEEQQAILHSVQHNPKTIVKSGTARGKDFITAVACCCFLYFTPEWSEQGELTGNTKVAMTAPTGRQVENIMYPEVVRLINRARARGFDLPGRLVGSDVRMPDKEWFLTGFKADEHQQEAWTGFHAVNVMFAVTEASGIPEEVFTAIEGNLQGNSRLLLVFNDNSGTGYAASAMRKKGWKAFRLDSLNAPNVVNHARMRRGELTKAECKRLEIPGQVDWNWVDGRVRDWCTVITPEDFREEEGDFWWENEDGKHCYRPNDPFRVKVRGMAPKVASGALVPPEWVELAQQRWVEHQANGFPLLPALRLGVDVAGWGRDNSAFVPRRGSWVGPIDMIRSGGTTNHMQVAGRIKATLAAETDAASGKTAQAFIDTIGEGAGVFSRLEEQAVKGVFSVKFSEGTEGAKWHEQDLTDATGCYRFLNMRAYLFWRIREFLNPAGKEKGMLPPDTELAEELLQITWFFRSDGTIQIEKKDEIKKRLGRSPDKADGLANTFYPVPDVDPTQKPKKNLANFFR
ncbi:hypothetical protein [Flaviaesturariibacter amylovorans]|uniref:DEAD/DEAH box helicase family protein n=1 Tax=Flaviaesturariibacter amylovorans TaxID=1084520 RepID=A0ABP8GR57_9BACT